MSNAEIIASIKKTWTEQMQQKEKTLTQDILDGYARWVQQLVKQVTERQAIQAQPTQQTPEQQNQSQQTEPAA